jgi:mannose-6-phosphate isomerase-like protein (cupin superfamily)
LRKNITKEKGSFDLYSGSKPPCPAFWGVAPPNMKKAGRHETYFRIKDGIHFQAGDQSLLCELLHPDRLEVPLQMGFSLAHAKVKPGQSTLTHKLSTSSEIYYILDGEGTIHIEQESALIHPGQVIYIPPNWKQYIQNTGCLDLTFLCMVYP